MRAGRLVLTRIKELAEARQDFGFETTLAGRGYVKLIADLKQAGYDIVLFFLWLPDDEVAVEWVANRVRQGGHDIPEATIRRRYEVGLRNFFRLYAPLVDSWHLYNGSLLPPVCIASMIDGTIQVLEAAAYSMIRSQSGS